MVDNSAEHNESVGSEKGSKGKLVREAMGVYLDDADTYEASQKQYEQETFKTALDRVREVNAYVDENILSLEEGERVLAAVIASVEINGFRDSKTGELNENGINFELAKLISHARRFGEGVVLAKLDLENFKNINDQIGYHAGDKVFEYFCEYLRSEVGLREEDFLARLGGDEFMIAFSDVEKDDDIQEDGISNVKGLQDKFSGEVLSDSLSQYITARMNQDSIDDKGVLITARIGFSELNETDDVSSLKEKADAAMNANRKPDETRR